MSCAGRTCRRSPRRSGRRTRTCAGGICSALASARWTCGTRVEDHSVSLPSPSTAATEACCRSQVVLPQKNRSSKTWSASQRLFDIAEFIGLQSMDVPPLSVALMRGPRSRAPPGSEMVFSALYFTAIRSSARTRSARPSRSPRRPGRRRSARARGERIFNLGHRKNAEGDGKSCR